MSVVSQLDPSGEKVLIQISGRFDFSCHADFRKAITDAAETAHVVVDLIQAEYMDSSALGLLLLLRQESGKTPLELQFAKNSVIEKVLQSSNFARLFDLRAV